MTNLSVTNLQVKMLREIAHLREAGVKSVKNKDLAAILQIAQKFCYANLNILKNKGLVHCDRKNPKPNSMWSVTENGYKCLEMAPSISNKPIRTKIEHERKHLGIPTTTDTLTITGTSAPTSVTTDTGTSIGLKSPTAGVDFTSKDQKKIEFETRPKREKKTKLPKEVETV